MRWLAALFVMFAAPAHAVACNDVIFDDHSFTVCAVDMETEDLRLFHSNDGHVIGNFRNLREVLGDQKLVFAMNAGMYHEDRSPVGLYRERDVVVSNLVTSDGPGNFGLLPNGVLCLTRNYAQVFETLEFVAETPSCRDASQSGPLLVINSQLHPRLLPDGTSKYIRNGVGTTRDGKTAYFAISNEPVNFHTFARLFRDHIEAYDALYFDGKVSRLYAPALNRDDPGFRLGPMIGVVE